MEYSNNDVHPPIKKGKPFEPKLTLDERTLLEHLKLNGPMRVKDLYHALCVLNPSLTKLDVTAMIWRLVDYQKINLEDD